MASIEKRVNDKNEIAYRVKIRLKGYPIETATFKRLTDAKRWVQQTEAAMREGRHFKTRKAKKHILSEAIDRYIKSVLPHKPKSQYPQNLQLQWWKENIGQHVLADVTPALIAQQREKLAKGTTARNKLRTPATVNRYLAALSHLFTIAVKEWGAG